MLKSYCLPREGGSSSVCAWTKPKRHDCGTCAVTPISFSTARQCVCNVTRAARQATSGSLNAPSQLCWPGRQPLHCHGRIPRTTHHMISFLYFAVVHVSLWAKPRLLINTSHAALPLCRDARSIEHAIDLAAACTVIASRQRASDMCDMR
jgi:hypothetical protein